MKIYFSIRFAKLYFANYIQGGKFEELNMGNFLARHKWHWHIFDEFGEAQMCLAQFFCLNFSLTNLEIFYDLFAFYFIIFFVPFYINSLKFSLCIFWLFKKILIYFYFVPLLVYYFKIFNFVPLLLKCGIFLIQRKFNKDKILLEVEGI